MPLKKYSLGLIIQPSLTKTIVISLNDAKNYHGKYVLKQESVNFSTRPLRAERFKSSV